MQHKGTFKDWANQEIPYRTTQSLDKDAHWVCEIAPHEQWIAYGSGRSAALALQSAQREWNQYDRGNA